MLDDKSPVMMAYATSALRWGGTMLAGTLVQHGIIAASQATEVTGGVVGGAMLLWSIYQKQKTAKALQRAATGPATTPPAVPK